MQLTLRAFCVVLVPFIDSGLSCRCSEPLGSTDASVRAQSDASSGAGDLAAKQIVFRSHYAMGSQVVITAWATSEREILPSFEAAFAEIDRLEGLLTVWRPTSDVSRINEAAGGEPVTVTPEVIEAIEAARRVSDLSSGKFDVTFGALSGLWRFDHDQNDRVPDRREIERRLPLVDYRDLVTDAPRSVAFLKRRGMRMHLGGIGKGFAVDRAVRILRGNGLGDFMIQAGGDLYVAGKRGDRPWRIGIRDPRGGPENYFAAAEVTDATFSTSGDYERSFIHEGVRYHHILDPDLGVPAKACRSVTVMAKDATLADGLSTAVFILGPKDGLPLVEGLDGVGAVIVDAQNRVHVSKRLEGRVTILHPPTDGL